MIWQNFTVSKSLSEALIFASTNPHYDNRLFIVHDNCKLRIPAEHVVYTICCFCFVLKFRTISVLNMFCRCCELLKKIYLYAALKCRSGTYFVKIPIPIHHFFFNYPCNHCVSIVVSVVVFTTFTHLHCTMPVFFT